MLVRIKARLLLENDKKLEEENVVKNQHLKMDQENFIFQNVLNDNLNQQQDVETPDLSCPLINSNASGVTPLSFLDIVIV